MRCVDKIISLALLVLTSACSSEQAVTSSLKVNDESNKAASANIAINRTSLAKVSTDFSAHWLSENIILVPKQYEQFSAQLVNNNVNKQSSALTKTPTPQLFVEKFPHLKSFQALQVSLSSAEIKLWLKSPLVVSFSKNGKLVHTAYVQTGNVIDDLYTSGSNDANEVTDLGATKTANSIQFKLWAPTAQKVSLLLFKQDKTPVKPAITMVENSHTGVWQALYNGPDRLKSSEVFYQYQVDVYHPSSKKIESLIVTDPYSLSLSVNSEYSHVIDLDDKNTQPNGWQQQNVPTVGAPENNIFYETHIRDFSAHDNQLANANHRGKYLAFTEESSNGINHLKALQQAGINNIHLLPSFDLGTINENTDTVIDINNSVSKVCQHIQGKSAEPVLITLCQKKQQYKLTIKEYLTSLPNDERRQAIVSALREIDNYNWGYDPFHYTVPEGSYALNADGAARIIEFRQMVQSIHQLGFRVIMDVVYNHTHQAGLAKTSILDKIVPNYYQRLDPISGEIAQSTCCDNTATERVMMEKLMIDSLVVWARDYKIDGFRFDLMAHQPKAAMLRARTAVQAVDPDNYFYGEGWNFGEVANNQRFIQASQLALGGSEIGTFTDRMRDAVRGGAFNATGQQIRKNQGIGNGLGTHPNELQSAELSHYALMMDQIRIGLAGNLANFPLQNNQGLLVTGKDVPYGDQPTGYALDPADTINYVSKHDNQTLWDNNQYRIAYQLSRHDRVRMQLQSLAFPLFAQGIPFIHMGSELLRSKSFLRDSYDYGDWFNKVDFSKQSNNYNVGLPPAAKDKANWAMINELLERNQGRDHATADDIQFSSAVFMELVKLRMSSPLFRLTDAQQIIDKVKFHNTGLTQQLGVIAMSIKGDASTSSLVIIFNTSSENKLISTIADAQNYQLHPIQQQSIDERVTKAKVETNVFYVPPLTTAVFIEQKEDLNDY